MFELWPQCSDAHLAMCTGFLMPVDCQDRCALERWCAGAGQSLPCGSTMAASPLARTQGNDGEESVVPDSQNNRYLATDQSEERQLAVRSWEAARPLGMNGSSLQKVLTINGDTANA